MLFSPARGFAADRFYDASFLATIRPNQPTVTVELKVAGERLPSRLEFHIDPSRHRAFISRDPVTTAGKVVTWKPSGKEARISY
ncbi:MAG TPA: hypothetical protein VNA21_16145, partial [Steroidobacteraceae bacterium]|nr:hypothetical protein [Steroidobacteraceae bacterium]